MRKLHIDLKGDQKLFFTSDLHVGHKNVLKFCNRPFLDIKDMSAGLIANWNSVVRDYDIVFDLGDMFWFDSRHEIKKFVGKLNGRRIYKVPGNHDMDSKKLFELCDPGKVEVLDDINTLWVTGLLEGNKSLEIVVCHYPLATFPHFEHAIQLFGHIHSGPLSDNEVDIPGKDLILKEGKQYDVGVDNNDYRPVEIREILKKLNKPVYNFGVSEDF